MVERNIWHKLKLFDYKLAELSNGELRLIILGHGKRKRIMNMSLVVTSEITPNTISTVKGAIQGYTLWYPEEFKKELHTIMKLIYPCWDESLFVN